MKIGDKVSYTLQHIRYSGVDKGRADSVGTVGKIEEIDNHECAQVFWDWAPDVGYWVRCGFLTVRNNTK